jgi:hypothetical protein
LFPINHWFRTSRALCVRYNRQFSVFRGMGFCFHCLESRPVCSIENVIVFSDVVSMLEEELVLFSWVCFRGCLAYGMRFYNGVGKSLVFGRRLDRVPELADIIKNLSSVGMHPLCAFGNNFCNTVPRTRQQRAESGPVYGGSAINFVGRASNHLRARAISNVPSLPSSGNQVFMQFPDLCTNKRNRRCFSIIFLRI